MKNFSPTTVIAWLRLVVALVLAVYLFMKLFTQGGDQSGAAIQASLAVHAAITYAVWMAIDKIFGLVESRFTADSKDIEALERKNRFP